MAVKATLSEVVTMGSNLRIAPADLADSVQVRLQRMYPGSRYIAAAHAVTIPRPTEKTDAELIEWTATVLTAILGATLAEPGSPAETTPTKDPTND